MQKWPSSAAAAAVVVRVSFWCGFSLTNNSAIWIQHVCKHHAKYRKKTDAATHTHATGSVFQFTTDSNSVLDLLFWLCTFTVNKKQRPAKIKFTLQSWFMPLNELESIFGCADLREWDNNVRLTVVCQKEINFFFVSSRCGLTRATVRNWLNNSALVHSALEEGWLRYVRPFFCVFGRR
jgi:hypothetical protein